MLQQCAFIEGYLVNAANKGIYNSEIGAELTFLYETLDVFYYKKPLYDNLKIRLKI